MGETGRHECGEEARVRRRDTVCMRGEDRSATDG